MKAHSALGIPAAFQMLVTDGDRGFIVAVEHGSIVEKVPIEKANGGDASAPAIARYILAARLKWGYEAIDPAAEATTLPELVAKVAANFPQA